MRYTLKKFFDNYFSIKDSPVISIGFSISKSSSIVGAKSQSLPTPSGFNFIYIPLSVTIDNGTKFVVWAVCGFPVS